MSDESSSESETESENYSETDEDDEIGLYNSELDESANEGWDEANGVMDCHQSDGSLSDDFEDEEEEEKFLEQQHRSLSNDRLIRLTGSSLDRTGNYQLLCTEDDVEQGGLSSDHFDNPLKKIWAPAPMSPVRRAFFLATIMFGILVVSVFLWVLPCNVEPCDPKFNVLPQPWFVELDNIGVNYTHLVEKVNGDLSLFLSFYLKQNNPPNLTRSNKFLEESKQSSALFNCGLLSLDEKDGRESWRITLQECPETIDCELVDVTGDGLKDCIVIGRNSMVVMVEPVYGIIVWRMHFSEDEGAKLGSRYEERNTVAKLKKNSDFPMNINSSTNIQRPLVLTDVNEDGFPELLFMIESKSFFSPHNYSRSWTLVLISGKSGSLVGHPFNISTSDCSNVNMMTYSGHSILYSCSNHDGKGSVRSIALSSLLNHIGITSSNTESLQKKTAVVDIDKPTIPKCLIRLKNHGKCPFCYAQLEYGLDIKSPISAVAKFDRVRVVSSKVLDNGSCKGVLLKLWKYEQRNINNGSMGKSMKYSSEKIPKNLFSPSMFPKPRGIIDTQSELMKPLKFLTDLLNGHDPQNALQEIPSYLDDSPLRDSIVDESIAPESLQNYHRVKRGGRSLRYIGKRTQNSPQSQLSDHSKSSASVNGASEKGKSIDFNSQDLLDPNYHNHTIDAGSNQSWIGQLLPPSEFSLNELEEVVYLYKFNGSSWDPLELGSLSVLQLCKGEFCVPSESSLNNSLVVDEISLRLPQWNVYSSSSTLSVLREPDGKRFLSFMDQWRLKAFVKKFIISSPP